MSVDPQHLSDEELKFELDRALGDVSAAELEKSLESASPRPVQADDTGRVRGTVVAIRGGEVIVDVGTKAEAFLPAEEFEGQPPEIGRHYVFVVQSVDTSTGQMRLSFREARINADASTLKIGDIIEGRVTGINIGGLELMIGNSLRAFMPKSQVELSRVEEFASYINRKLECQVTEIDRKGRHLVVSRRRLLERQRADAGKELRQSLEPGQVRHGIVRRLAEFGAFVDIGGVDGLLHIGDMTWGRVKHPNEVVKEGDEVQVVVLKIDPAKDRISLGMKQLAPDPWDVVSANFRQGQTVDGRVVKLMDFGAFVELSPGIEGLLPVSEISWTQRVRHPKDVLKEGDPVRVSVLSVDPEQRRISLSLKALGEDPWKSAAERYSQDTVVSGLVLRTAAFGAFIQLEEGIEGLAHISELADRHVKRVEDVCKPGDVVQVRIKSVDSGQRRISLSLRMPQAEPEHIELPPEHTKPSRAPKRKRELRGGLSW